MLPKKILIEALKDRAVIPFVGAGVSHAVTVFVVGFAQTSAITIPDSTVYGPRSIEVFTDPFYRRTCAE